MLCTLLAAWYTQGVSSHGKPGKVMEFHFHFPGLKKSWNLTRAFGKFIKNHGNYKASSCETAWFGSYSKYGYGYVQKIEVDCNLVHHIVFKLTPSHTGYGLSHRPSLPQYAPFMQ